MRRAAGPNHTTKETIDRMKIKRQAIKDAAIFCTKVATASVIFSFIFSKIFLAICQEVVW